MKKKFICTVCGYIYEGAEAPAECPVCHVKADKFKEFNPQALKGTKTEQNLMRVIFPQQLRILQTQLQARTTSGPTCMSKWQSRLLQTVSLNWQ